MIGRHSKFSDRMLLLTIFFQGPWDRLSNWCYGLRKDTSIRWEIPAEPKGVKWVLAKIGNWAEQRDKLWLTKYAFQGKEPHKRWNRRPL